MSFLNPVSEPVLRFSSTDADAPQINYAARTAGDVKTVLKACLVTGYGAKAGAGWSIVNEVDHVAEFMSPSAAMSDYRLGIDDSTATNTQYYYVYKDTVSTQSIMSNAKVMSSINKVDAGNRWDVLTTDKGFFIVETVYSTAVSDYLSRVTYFGALKSALTDTGGKNISLWSVGVASPATTPNQFFGDAGRYISVSLSNVASYKFAAINIAFAANSAANSVSTAEVISPIFLCDGSDGFVAKLPAVLLRTDVPLVSKFGIYDAVVDGRPVLRVCAGIDNTNATITGVRSRNIDIYLDYWGY